MLTGKHYIAGTWVEGSKKFANEPAFGAATEFSVGQPEHVDMAAKAAEDAFLAYSSQTRGRRAAFLRCIADEIERRADQITEIGSKETGLPAPRLEGERARTVGQLKLFAKHIEKGDFLDFRHDPALPDRQPLPRPDLRLIQRAIGPVAVFGASNFPLAFSTAGGDTASALAAGCPVIVKGHSAHPGTSEVVALAISAAVEHSGQHPGVFSLIQGGKRDVGEALVRHPLICAVGFTGSLGGGRALFNLAQSRGTPIPFYGELGSVNPMFIFEQAASCRARDIAKGWAASLTMGAGQFCTNPGIALIREGAAADEFVKAATAELEKIDAQTMLTIGMASAFASGAKRIQSAETNERLGSRCDDRRASPALFETSSDVFLADRNLAQEVFGPLGLVVRVGEQHSWRELAQSFEGQLTCTLHLDAADHPVAKEVLPILERKAGRLLCNGFPTGVEVCDAMMHGGPYPASTNTQATSVGTLAIRRFLRPVAFQNFGIDLLDDDLKQ